MAWFRIDNRLVHGQVIEGWLPYLNAGYLIVANDALASDELQQQIMRLAIPGRVWVSFVPVNLAKPIYDKLEGERRSSLFLLATCQDGVRLVEQGVTIPLLNVGNMHYAHGKRQLCAHVAISDEDAACLEFFRRRGTLLDFRCVPTDIPVVEEGW